MGKQHTEMAFEATIEQHLLTNGWHQGSASTYRVDLGIDTDELIRFVEDTQAERWEQLVVLRSGRDQAVHHLTKRVASEIDSRGTVHVLRKGVEDLGIQFDLAYWAPAHHITGELWELYNGNRSTVSRQVHHSESNSQDSVDVLLLLNGVPVATAELKNQLTGQNVKNALAQYENDRNPADLIFRARALAHFAVDQDLVFMTTRLAHNNTHWLPFNQGSGGPGQQGGAGNPINPNGYRTAYLWEAVWQRDAWLEIIGSFAHEDTGGKSPTKIKSHERKILVPRFHQWDSVRKIAAHVRSHGPGHNYLAMHSAGSGKSNTIAWLASALATLHTSSDPSLLGPGSIKIGLGADQPVFNKIIIVTDRVALDRQLQSTVTSFDHTPGTIQQIDQNSKQLHTALQSAKARIIITTLQKFPVVAAAATELQGTRFAVIVDEAHSSQTGEAAKDLKAVLTASDEIKDDEEPDLQDLLAKSVETRGHQDNLSFFAFTATPKQKTLALFGETETALELLGGVRHVPFHLYSMRQAIDEGFVLDVLANYLSYSTYYRLANGLNQTDPEVPKGKAAAALARYVSLHPSAYTQKAEIIVEHFRHHTAEKIGGKAKAMVVTRSRLHAVRMKHAVDTYIAKKNYTGIAALIAFSGTVFDPDNPAADPDKGFTEASMNKFSDSVLPKKFASDDYQILIVAEKYQTGFDQPLLHTMYVDKKLEGVKAVQTLSRLNRTHPGKVDTFVLDFVNSSEDIAAAFAPFYERSWSQPTDPNVLSNLKTRVLDASIIDLTEMQQTVTALLADTTTTNEALYAGTDLAIGRFLELDASEREDFRTALRDYVRLYAFLSQIVPFKSIDMEQLYLYGRVLLARLPRSEDDEFPDLSEAAVLTHLRIDKGDITDASLSPVGEEASEIIGLSGEGRGKQDDQPLERLSAIIEVLNNRFGLALTEADQLFFEQVETEIGNNQRAIDIASNNDLDQFMTVFEDILEGVMIDRHSGNDALLTAFLDKPEFRETVTRMIGKGFYDKIRSSRPE